MLNTKYSAWYLILVSYHYDTYVALLKETG